MNPWIGGQIQLVGYLSNSLVYLERTKEPRGQIQMPA